MNETLRMPNLFIIGAMKSGTSSLHAWLGAHPEVFMCEPKEPCYFVDRADLDWPYIEQLGLWRGEEFYLELFKDAGDATILGESSTLYTKLPRIKHVPERIARFNSDARFIYVMRDPIERTISHYWHMVRHHGEHRSLEQTVREQPDYCDVSHYAMQLRPYLDAFGEDRILALTFEELIRDTRGVMQRILEWLQVDSTIQLSSLSARENVTPHEVVQVRGRGLLNLFRHSRLWCSLGPRVPRTIRNFGRYLSEQKVERDFEQPDSLVSWLRPIQLRQTEQLQGLLRRDFPEWTTLYGEGPLNLQLCTSTATPTNLMRKDRDAQCALPR